VRRRLLAAAAALVLAAVGGTVLLAYARGADARAMAGLQTQTVLVAADRIPAGTPAAGLAKQVRSQVLPATAVVPGAVRDLAALGSRVTTTELEPGEQLLASRFGAASALLPPGTVAVPAGDEEISVQLDPERAIGGRLGAGDHVGVFVSLSMQDGSAATHAVLHHVLVTQVQGAVVPTAASTSAATGTQTAAASSSDSSSGSSSGASSTTVMVTLALTAQDAEAVVFGQEHGKVWLSLEPDAANTGGTTVVTPGNVYTNAYPDSPR
jgi:pilus assembly protein CpaB